MTSAKIRQLYNYVPGFKNDKDEEWACYLPSKDQSFLRKSRKHYLILMDQLDELKLEQKDCPAGSQQSLDIANKIKDLSKQIDDNIKLALSQIPELKRKGLEAREKRIEEDLRFDERSSGHSRLEPTLEDETEVLDSFSAFMPRTHFDEPTTSAADDSRPEAAGADQEQTDRDHDLTDTYLDGVESENVEMMEKLRHFADKFKCRDHILEALRKYRKQQSTLSVLEYFKSHELKQKPNNTKTAAPVPMEQDG